MKTTLAVLCATLATMAGSVLAHKKGETQPLQARDDWHVTFWGSDDPNCQDLTEGWPLTAPQGQAVTFAALPENTHSYITWSSDNGYPGTVKFGYNKGDGQFDGFNDLPNAAGDCLAASFGYTAAKLETDA